MLPLRTACALSVVGLIVTSAGAQQSLYFENFESGSAWPEWSTNRTDETYPTFTRFLGRFSNDTVQLTLELPALPQNAVIGDGGEGGGGGAGEGGGGSGGSGGGGGGPWTYLLSFRFYCIDSWDGADTLWGPDRFRVLVNTTTLLDETFGPVNPDQPYRAPSVGHAHLGFNAMYVDAIYDIALPFTAPPGQTTFTFEAMGLQNLEDESWGIDDVRVSMVQLIPAPGAASAAAALGLLAMRRRRR